MGAWEWEQGHLEAVSQLKYLPLLEHFNLVASFQVVLCFFFFFFFFVVVVVVVVVAQYNVN